MTVLVPDAPTVAASRAYAKILWRIVPILLVAYGIGFMDRINVSYAQLAMHQQLGFSDEVYGLGAGLFSVGYFFFEVPSNLCMARFGGRKYLAALMIVWSFASAATAMVATPMQFYLIRFILGSFEAGLFPGLILFVSLWFPVAKRGWVIAMLTIASLVANTICGPISGWILENLDGAGGIRNWQWLFILEALPAFIWGIVAFVGLVSRPGEARWLSPAEKAAVLGDLHADEALKGGDGHMRGALVRDPRIYVLGFGIFAVLCGYFSVMYWMPMIIQAAGISNIMEVGLWAMIPNILAAFAMYATTRVSEKVPGRHRFYAVPLFLAALGLALTSVQGNLSLSLFALSVAFAGVMSSLPTFWVMATSYLPAAAAPFGIAYVNTMGVVAGFVSPYLVGFIRTHTGSMVQAFAPMWIVMAAGAIVVPLCMPTKRALHA